MYFDLIDNCCSYYCGGEAKTWEPDGMQHVMTGLDLAIWHGNIEAFDLLVTLRTQHPVSFKHGELHEWLDNDELCELARNDCVERRNNHYILQPRLTEKFPCISSYDTDSEDIDYVLASARTYRKLGVTCPWSFLFDSLLLLTTRQGKP